MLDHYNSMSGIDFELLCKELLEKMGFETETTKASGDGGIDLITYNYQPILSGKYIIQCKRYTGSVGEPIIRDLYGVITSELASKGILITTGHFTKSAINFADDKPIELIDGENLQKLLIDNGIDIGKSNAFFAKLLSTIGINDFENICMQFINSQSLCVRKILKRDAKYILMEVSDEDNLKKLLYICY